MGAGVASLIGIRRRYGVVPAVTALAFVLLAGGVVGARLSLTAIQSAAAGSRYSFVRDGVGRSESEAEYRQPAQARRLASST